MFWGHLIDNHALSYFPEESKEYISHSFSALIFKIKKLLVTNIFKWLKSQNMKMYILRLLQSLSPSILFIPDRYFTSFLFFFIYFFFRQQYIFPPPPFFYKRYYNVYFFYLVNFSCYIPMHRNYIMMCRHTMFIQYPTDTWTVNLVFLPTIPQLITLFVHYLECVLFLLSVGQIPRSETAGSKSKYICNMGNYRFTYTGTVPFCIPTSNTPRSQLSQQMCQVSDFWTFES